MPYADIAVRREHARVWSAENVDRIKARHHQELLAEPELHRQRFRAQDLRRKFGITVEEYDAMLAVQNYVCGMCGRPEKVRRNGRVLGLSVDHDHVTGEIRELLCVRCNQALGVVEAYGCSAAEYLGNGPIMIKRGVSTDPTSGEGGL